MGTVMPECVFKFNWIPNVVCPEMRRGLTAQKFFPSVRKVFAVKTWPFLLFLLLFVNKGKDPPILELKFN